MLNTELNLTGKRLPIVRILIAIKSQLTGAGWFYLTFIIFKLLGLIIITSNFIPLGEGNSGYKVTSILRSITMLGIFGKTIDMTSYYISCVLIFVLLIICFFSIAIILNRSKEDGEYLLKSDAKKLIIFICIIFQILLICSQHIVEYLSFIFMIQFNTSVDLTKSLFNNIYLNKDYFIFQNTNTNLGGIIILILNTTGIIFLNFFHYYSIKIINEPFYDSDFHIRFKSSKISTFVFMLVSNLQGLNYIEIFIQDLIILKTFKIVTLGIIMVLLLISFLKTYYTFNFYNIFNYLINFLLNYAFFSCLIELSLYFANEILNNLITSLFNFFVKLLFSFSFTFLNIYLNEKILMNRLNQALFQNYHGEISKYDLNCLFYIMNLIFGIKNKNNEENTKFFEIIISHKNECMDDSCKCQSIIEFNHDKLIPKVNKIIESIFINLNLDKDPIINMMFSEYLYYQKESILFSWSILNTYVSKNYSKDSQFMLFSVYLLILKKVYQYEAVMKKTENYVHFMDVFSQVSFKKKFEKKIFKIMKNYEKYVGLKEKFDFCLKINYINNVIEADLFSNCLTDIVNMCNRHQILYKELKTHIKQDFSVTPLKSIEVSYKLYTFFQIFNKKIPKNILSLIILNSTINKKSEICVQRYFNKTFYKYFNDKKSYLNMIIEIDKIFKIKYINHKLCQALGFKYESLINNDIHQLFPAQLKESHKKVLLNHFLIRKQVSFKKKTFAFTRTKNIFPLDLTVSTFPGLKKNLQAIVSIQPVEEKDIRSFFFVITEFFELIAISENFETIYNINFDLIDKLGINVLKLFEIEGLIPIKFKSQMDEIQKERQEKQFDYLYSLSKFLFNQNNNEDFKSETVVEVKKDQKNIENIKDLGLKLKHNINQDVNNDELKNSDYLSKSLFQGEVKSNVNGDNKFSIDENILQNEPNLKSSYKLKIKTTEKIENKNSKKRGSFIASKVSLSQINSINNPKKIQPDQQGKFQDTETQNLLSEKIKQENNDYFSVVRDKSKIISNLDQLKNRIKDTEIGYKFLSKLNQAINNFNNSYHSTQNENKNIASSSGITKNRRLSQIRRTSLSGTPSFSFNTHQHKIPSMPNLEETKKQKETLNGNEFYSENFTIKVLFRKINDAPFFIINVKEKEIIKAPIKTEIKPYQKISLLSPLTVIGEYDELKQTSKNTDKYKNLNQTRDGEDMGDIKTNTKISSWNLKLKNKFKDSKQRRRSTKMGLFKKLKEFESKFNSDHKNIETNILSDPKGILKSIQRKIKYINNNRILPIKKIPNEQQKIIEEGMTKEKLKSLILNIVMGFILIINFLAAVLVYFLKVNILNTKQEFFNIQLLSLAQENSLLTLHSSLISFIFLINNYSTFNNNYLSFSGKSISIYDLKFIIEERSNFQRNTFAKLFSLTKSTYFKMTELEYLFYTKKETYQTLILTWDSKPIQQTFIEVVDYICSNSRSFSFENSYNDLITNIDNAFLYQQFKQLENLEIKSNYSKLIYYFNQNFILIDQNIKLFSLAIENAKSDFNLNTKNTCIFLEISNIILSFTSIVLIHITLYTSNKNLFKILLSMFLNLKKEENSNFKATFECQIMRKKLQMYHELIKTFSVETLRNFDETLYLGEKDAFKLINEIHEKNKKIKDEKFSFLNGLYCGIILGDPSKIRIEVNQENSELDNSLTSNNSFSFLKGSNESLGSLTKNSLYKNQERKKMNYNENMFVITNEQILTLTKNYTINFVKFAKILISIIFCLYIFFILANFIANALYHKEIDDDIKLVSSFVMKYPAAFRIFNMIRLMIFSNDMSFVENFNEYKDQYDMAYKSSQVLYNSYSSNLPKSFYYHDTILTQTNNLRTDKICVNEITKEICEVFLRKENEYNKEGIDVAASAVILKLINIYKDYIKEFESGQIFFTGIDDSKNTVKKYFFTEEFININLEMEYVFEQISRGLFLEIEQDIGHIFSTILNLEKFLGLASIILYLVIIIYLVFGFFSMLRVSIGNISYSAKKFNRAMFES